MYIDNSYISDTVVGSLTLLKKDSLEHFVESITHTTKPISIGFVNQHAYNLVQANTEVMESFQDLDYLLRDGIGMSMACSLHGCDPGLNLNGTDFIPYLIHHVLEAKPSSQFMVFGTQDPWLTSGAQCLLEGHSCLALDGFLDDEEYIRQAHEHLGKKELTVIVLAMGMPKQERIAKKLKASIKQPLLIICGGAIIDFSAKRFARAPLILRQWGLEWLYRLVSEPKRLFKRYVIGIPVFFYLIVKNKVCASQG